MHIRIGTVVGVDTEGDEHDIPAVELVLSERNLKSLLATITDENNSITRFTEAGVLMVIRSEPNDVHYADRPAGLMSEEVELQLAAEEFANDETLYVPDGLVDLD